MSITSASGKTWRRGVAWTEEEPITFGGGSVHPFFTLYFEGKLHPLTACQSSGLNRIKQKLGAFCEVEAPPLCSKQILHRRESPVAFCSASQTHLSCIYCSVRRSRIFSLHSGWQTWTSCTLERLLSLGVIVFHVHSARISFRCRISDCLLLWRVNGPRCITRTFMKLSYRLVHFLVPLIKALFFCCLLGWCQRAVHNMLPLFLDTSKKKKKYYSDKEQ